MPDKFKYRSDTKEFLDELNIPRDLLYKNLRELDLLNKTTGGNSISLKGIKQLITDRHKKYQVVDLGCGSGYLLRSIAEWARRHNFTVQLIGVDRNAQAIEYLKSRCINYPEISGIAMDYSDFLEINNSIDIVHSSLFCHHLNDEELLHLFVYFKRNVKVGFIINDLRRHWLAYYAAWFSTRLLNGTELAKNDGPVSVLRGFKKAEIQHLLSRAMLNDYTFQKVWGFRFLVVGNVTNYGTVE